MLELSALQYPVAGLFYSGWTGTKSRVILPQFKMAHTKAVIYSSHSTFSSVIP